MTRYGVRGYSYARAEGPTTSISSEGCVFFFYLLVLVVVLFTLFILNRFKICFLEMSATRSISSEIDKSASSLVSLRRG